MKSFATSRLRRSLRSGRTAVSAISAVVALLLLAMWCRSYAVGDAASVTLQKARPAAGGRIFWGRIIYVGSYAGRFQLMSYPSPATSFFLWGTPGRPWMAISRHAQARHYQGWFGFTASIGVSSGVFGFTAPYWAAVLIASLLPVMATRAAYTRRRRSRSALCIACGYDLRGNPASGRCPECGSPAPAPAAPCAPDPLQ